MDRRRRHAIKSRRKVRRIVGTGLLALGGIFVFGAIALGQGGPSNAHLRVAVDSSGTGGNTPPPTPYAVVGGPKITTKHRPVFSFASNVSGGTFRCQLDGDTAIPCTSPFKIPRRLKAGKHTLVVQAVDSHGTTSTPVFYRFKIVNHPLRRH